MITYAKSLWGLHHLLRLYGSAIPRTLPFAIFSAALTALFIYVPHRSYFSSLVFSGYAYQLFAAVVGFALVFRTNFSYTRYWEGRTELQAMTAHLMAACTRALAFEAASISPAQLVRSASVGPTTPGPTAAAHHHHHHQQHQQQASPAQSRRRPSFSTSNLPSQAAQGSPAGAELSSGSARQRPERPLDGVELQSPPEQAQRQPSGGLGSYSWRGALEDFWKQQKEQPAPQENGVGGSPAPPPPVLPPLPPKLGASPGTGSAFAPAAAAEPCGSPRQGWVPRPPSGYATAVARVEFLQFRDDLLHLASLFHALALQHLRVDWRLDNLTEFKRSDVDPPPLDARGLEGYKGSPLNVFMLRGTADVRAAYNKAMKLPVIGAISPESKLLLKQQSEMDPMEMTDTVFSGVDRRVSGEQPRVPRAQRHLFRLSFLAERTASLVEGGPERVYTAYTWIELLLAGRAKEGGVRWKLPAPITATVWAQLASALSRFEQCRKLADTPFPFPWAQTIIVFLLIYTLTVPIMVAAYISNAWLATLLSFIAVLTYWALNEVARDLEDPYIYDPNDLPLARHQYDFNKRMLAASDTVLLSLQHGGI